MEIILVLHNIRSIYNVGAILRTAEGFGVARVVCSGYTPWFRKPGTLPHLSAKLEHQISKTALGAEKLVEVSFSEDITSEMRRLKGEGWQILGLENNLSAPTILLNNREALLAAISERIVLVLGEEVSGIPEELQKEIDQFIEIPMKGQKESFNVSIATGVALFALTTLKNDARSVEQ
ncbi:TrmH family RNA methyltransferase [Candidatus Saccharibacteria bacterium]|nr:TrmH family RNA methyltransferase [Candidatus Saccharibacteria bacterium]